MFDSIKVEKKHFSDYKSIITPELYEQVLEVAKELKGKRILEISATAKGGGVAEILRSQVALEQDLGIEAHWWVLRGNHDFFETTKMIHNALQGDRSGPTETQWLDYEDLNRQLAAEVKPGDWDYIMVHDPQPLALRQFVPGADKARWAWRCHIDSSFPNKSVGERIAGYLDNYDGAVFSLKQYYLPHLRGQTVAKHLAAIPVAIDPLSRKNQGVSHTEALKRIKALGVDIEHPYIAQISRFDPWKDPLGVIEAWRLAKQKVPQLQLIMMGDTASDDPEGVRVLEMARADTKGLADVFIVTESDDLLVNAVQQTANVVLQKSLREGFGLTVAEALWAGRPVIGGDVGGIPLQIKNGQDGYLVTSVTAAAERIIELVQNPAKATAMGQTGRELVRREFLLPRLLRDQLRFWVSLEK